MAKTNVAKQGKAGEQPVESGIHRAAERIGLEPEDDGDDTPPGIARQVLKFTLRELCDAIGHEVRPNDFAATALEAIAQQIEAEGMCCEHESGRFNQLFSIQARAEFAASVVRQLAEVES
jgi:hypothetical protein